MGETVRRIYGFFKRLFGRRSELERRVALLEINCELLKQRHEALNEGCKSLSASYGKLSADLKELRTVSARTTAEEEPISGNRILNEWLNGEDKDDEWKEL